MQQVMENITLADIDRLCAGTSDTRMRSLTIYNGQSMNRAERYTIKWDYSKDRFWYVFSPEGVEIGYLAPIEEK